MLTANRVAAIAAFLTGIGSALAGIESSLPTKTANTVATAVGVIGSIVTCLHFMLGSQKYDALQVQPVAAASDVPDIAEFASVPADEPLVAAIAAPAAIDTSTLPADQQPPPAADLPYGLHPDQGPVPS